MKIWQLWALKSYKVFMEPPYTIVALDSTFFLSVLSFQKTFFGLEDPTSSLE